MVRRTPLTREEKIAQMEGLKTSASRTAPNIFANQQDRSRDLVAPPSRFQSGLLGAQLATDASRKRDAEITKASQPLLATSTGRINVLEDPTGELTGIRGFKAGQEGTQARTFATSQAAQQGQSIIAQRTQQERQRVLSAEASKLGLPEGSFGFDESGKISVNLSNITQGQSLGTDIKNNKKGFVFSGEFSSDPEIAQAQRGLAQARATRSANVGSLERNLQDLLLNKLGRRDLTDITAQLTPEEQQQLATTGQTQALGLATGGAGGVDPNLQQTARTLQSLGIDTRGFITDQNGNIVRDPDADQVELDPFKRASKRLAEDDNLKRREVARQFNEAEDRIRERFTFLTGPRAGQLTEQGRRELSRLKSKKDKKLEDINRDFDRGLEDVIIQEKSRQVKIEEESKKKKEKSFSDLQDEAVVSVYNNLLNQGAGRFEALNLAKKFKDSIGADPKAADTISNLHGLKQEKGGLEYTDILNSEYVSGDFSKFREIGESLGLTQGEIDRLEIDAKTAINPHLTEEILREQQIKRSDEEEQFSFLGGQIRGNDLASYLDRNQASKSPEAFARLLDTALINGSYEGTPEEQLIRKSRALADVFANRGNFTLKEFNDGLFSINPNTGERRLLMKKDVFASPEMQQQRFTNMLTISDKFQRRPEVQAFKIAREQMSRLNGAIEQIGIERTLESIKDLDENDFKKLGLPQGRDASKLKQGGSLIAVDQALIMVFNKMLDYESVVRQEEYNRTANDQSMFRFLTGKMKQIVEGGAGLEDADRAAIGRMAGRFWEVAQERYGVVRNNFFNEAMVNNVNPYFVVDEPTPLEFYSGDRQRSFDINQLMEKADTEDLQFFERQGFDTSGFKGGDVSNNLDDFFDKQIMQESGGNDEAVSPAGAVGRVQLMPDTARRMGLKVPDELVELHKEFENAETQEIRNEKKAAMRTRALELRAEGVVDERFDGEKNEAAARKLMGILMEKYKDTRLALAAYNAGEGRVDGLIKGDKNFENILNSLPRETQNYVTSILG